MGRRQCSSCLTATNALIRYLKGDLQHLFGYTSMQVELHIKDVSIVLVVVGCCGIRLIATHVCPSSLAPLIWLEGFSHSFLLL